MKHKIYATLALLAFNVIAILAFNHAYSKDEGFFVMIISAVIVMVNRDAIKDILEVGND